MSPRLQLPHPSARRALYPPPSHPATTPAPKAQVPSGLPPGTNIATLFPLSRMLSKCAFFCPTGVSRLFPASQPLRLLRGLSFNEQGSFGDEWRNETGRDWTVQCPLIATIAFTLLLLLFFLGYLLR